jgi:hypothetical protein
LLKIVWIQILFFRPFLRGRPFFGRPFAIFAGVEGVEDAQDEGPPEYVFAIVLPGRKPNGVDAVASRLFGSLQILAQHAHEAGLAAAPGAKDADGQRGLGRVQDRLQGGSEIGEVEGVFCRPAVGQIDAFGTFVAHPG